ncbi:MAG: DKNYY domain-containing protein [Planctomycetota bacterium]
MNKALKFTLWGLGIALLLVVAGVFMLVSRLMPGYEVRESRVFFRSFNNLNWKVERKEVTEANPDSIRTLRGSGGLYAKDKETAFFRGIWIKDADIESFRVLDWRKELSRDRNWVYWTSIRLSNDPNHFEVLDGGYSRDRENVYYASSAIKGADANSFVVTSPTTGRGRDNKREYNLGRPVD